MQSREQTYRNVESLIPRYGQICNSLTRRSENEFSLGYSDQKQATSNFVTQDLVELLMLAKAFRLRKKSFALNDYFMFFSSLTGMTDSLARIIGQELLFSETSLNARVNFIMKSDKGHYNSGSIFLNGLQAEIILIESAGDKSNFNYLETHLSPLFNNLKISFISSQRDLIVQADSTSCPWYSLVYLGLIAKMSRNQLQSMKNLPVRFSIYSQSLSTLSALEEKYPREFQETQMSNLTSEEPKKIAISEQIKRSTFLLPDLGNKSEPNTKKLQPKVLDFKIKRILGKAKTEMRSIPSRENFAMKFVDFLSFNQVYFMVKVDEISDEELKKEIIATHKNESGFLKDLIETQRFKFFGAAEFLNAAKDFVNENGLKSLTDLLSGKYDQEFVMVVIEYYQKYFDEPNIMNFAELVNLESENPYHLRHNILDWTPPNTPPSSPPRYNADEKRPKLERGSNFL